MNDITLSDRVQRVKPSPTLSITARVAELRAGGRDIIGLGAGEPDDFRVRTAEQLTESFNQVIDTITYVMGGIVGISLLVGGIGIMNIMLVSVTERTREIGVRKSVGARRRDILNQFLMESLVITLAGTLKAMGAMYGPIMPVMKFMGRITITEVIVTRADGAISTSAINSTMSEPISKGL